MNEALGERTIAKGYVPAPQIGAGNSFVDSVGGGISQVATMLYNGAFFAGLELIEHQPHSLYIDRYPLGREATISWGGPELIFRNDWPASVLIKLDATDTSITVRFFSSRLGRRVETETSVPYGHGGGSFTVDYTRRVYRGSRLARDERFRVRYGVSPGSGAPGWYVTSPSCRTPVPNGGRREMTRSQRFTLVAAILGSSVAAIDGTIVNVALPAIQADLGGGLQTQQWIANAYLLTLGSLILIGGSLGDIYGRRRVFALGVGSFGVLSLACAVAPSTETLIAARALQGVAGALLTPSSLAIIAAAFSERARGAAIGSWTAWGGIAIIVGPLAGGVIVDQASWRWIFAINVPVVLVTLLLVRGRGAGRAGGAATHRLSSARRSARSAWRESSSAWSSSPASAGAARR